ncbi:unnamed protein product [Camellia sinensis]
MIPELPTHIVFDILSRLPIKTLFNCRSVCKLWLSLISSDPQFAKLHLSRSHPSLLFKPINRIREPKKLHLVDLQIAPYTHPRINMLNSRNGLLCLCEPGTNDPIYVCNPILGLQTNGDYNEAEIYMLGEGLWRSIGKTPCSVVNDSFDAFLNGALHWLPFGVNDPDFIFCFDFGSEQFRVVPEPSEFDPLLKEFSCQMRVGDYGVKESWSKDIVIKGVIYDWDYSTCYEPVMILQSGKRSDFHGIAHVPSLVSLRDVAKGENLKYYDGARDFVFVYFTFLSPFSLRCCLSLFIASFSVVLFNDPIYVCNPILGEYITLPKSPDRSIPIDYPSSFVAFGFSLISNQCKVVRSVHPKVLDPMTRLQVNGDYDEAEMYTLGEGSWRSIGKTPYIIVNDSFNAVLIGACHWLPFFCIVNDSFDAFLNDFWN